MIKCIKTISTKDLYKFLGSKSKHISQTDVIKELQQRKLNERTK